MRKRSRGGRGLASVFISFRGQCAEVRCPSLCGHRTLNADSETQPPALAHRRILWFGSLAALLAVHAVLVDRFVPCKRVFVDAPLTGVDYDLHVGQVFRVVEALQGWGKSWLYDVQLLAGQPEGTITDAGSKGWELWTFALSSLGVPRAIAFNSFVLFVMLVSPVLMLMAAFAFRLGPRVALVAAGMTSTLWFFDSHLHWLWFVGMISWSGASCLAILTVGLHYRFVVRPRVGAAVLCGASAGLCLLIHPYTFFVMAVPMIAMYARAARRMSRRDHGCTLLIVALPIVFNAFWLLNAAEHWHYILNSAFYAQARPQHALCDVLDLLCNGADSGVIGTRTGFRFLYLGAAVAGFLTWRAERDSRLLPIAAGLVLLYFMSYLGGYIPGMQQTQPYRQITPAMMLTTLPAASCLTRCFSLRVWQSSSIAVKGLLAALSFSLIQLLLATQIIYFFPEWVPMPAVHPDGIPSPLSGYGHVWHPDLPIHVHYTVPHPDVMENGAEAIVHRLEALAKPGERVLVEGSFLGERIAWRTRLEVLGGFFERNLQHVDANYFREHLTYPAPPEALLHYLRTFAVQWVVTLRPEFNSIPAMLRQVDTIGNYRIYQAQVGISKVLRGTAVVSASENRIEVSASDPDLPLVLSYHWHEALRCRPACRIERQPIDIDRVGFIRVPAPHPAHLMIWNSYE